MKGTKKVTPEQVWEIDAIIKAKGFMSQPYLPDDNRWRYPLGVSDETIAAGVKCATNAVAKRRRKWFTEGFIPQMPPRLNRHTMPPLVEHGDPDPHECGQVSTDWADRIEIALQDVNGTVSQIQRDFAVLGDKLMSPRHFNLSLGEKVLAAIKEAVTAAMGEYTRPKI